MVVQSFIRSSLFAAGFLLGASCLQAQAASCPGAEIVKGAAASFAHAAEHGTIPDFAAALARYADVDEVAMFALGPYRKDLPPSQRAAYVKNATRFMSQVLASNARRFTGADLTIGSCKGDLVETSLDGRTKVLWRVSKGRVQDVQVEGVWLAPQLRSKFTDIIRRARGDVSALLLYLRRRA